MYDRAKEQQKEIATIKERTIHLNLSDADCKRISTYAAKANITVSQLLGKFYRRSGKWDVYQWK